MAISEAFLVVIPLLVIEGLLWFHSDKIYSFHKDLQERYPVVFDIVGYNRRYLSSPNLWIKHFRIHSILFVLLFVSILLFHVFG